MFLPFSRPDITSAEADAVIDVINSGWLTTGKRAAQFEGAFRDFLGDGSLHCMAVNSATSGLHLALEALGVGVGDEVIVPTYTFTATAEVVRYLGATPVFVDVDPTTFNITWSAIEGALSEQTKAVIVVHFAGLACDMKPIIEGAKSQGIKIVEDAAHALPTTYSGQLIGTLGTDATVFSFYANKTMTTGEGGMVVTRSAELADRCKVMRLHGISRDAFDRYSSTKPSWFYEVVAPGFKYNLTDLAASIGIVQLSRLESFLRKREYIAEIYFSELADLPLLLPAKPAPGDIHAWHLFTLQLAEPDRNRDDVVRDLFELGLGCSVHFIPLHRQPYWRDEYNLKGRDFPVAEKVFSRVFSIPLFTAMDDSEIEFAVTALRKVFGYA